MAKLQKRNSTVSCGEDYYEENGVLFWINRSGFPLDECTWKRMWDHVAHTHPGGAAMTQRIRDQETLPEVPVPQAPLSFSSAMPMSERLEKIQAYMSDLEYNHTGTQFYEIKKNRPVYGLMECAREMIRESLPIKCLEAVVLAIFLTNGMPGVERFPINFRSCHEGQVFRHVVLGVYHNGRYGALGMSRRQDLMFKPVTFKSLSDLIFDFHRCYTKYWHTLEKVKVGMPISHDQHSFEGIEWRGVSLAMNKLTHKEICKLLEQHSRTLRGSTKSWDSPYSTKNVSTMESSGTREAPQRARDPSPVRITRVRNNTSVSAKNRKSTGTLDFRNAV